MSQRCTPVGPEIQKLIIEKHTKGIPNAQIAREIGRHCSTVGRIIKTYDETGKMLVKSRSG